MTVGHMRDEMSEREYREWIAYYRLEYEREARAAIHARDRARRKGR
jgi:hypothetical protein